MHSRSAIPWLLSALVIAGCSRGPNIPRAVPVSGTVTLDGKPFPGLAVVFTPVGTTHGGGGSGFTNEDGKYELTARYGRKKGSPVGDYWVMLRMVARGSPVEAVGLGKATPATSSKTAGDSLVKMSLPAKYAGGMKATVHDTDNVIDFPLTSKN